MSSVSTVALTILGTVIAGVLVYVLGKIIERAFIEPLNDYRQLVVEIAGALAMYARFWGNTSFDDFLSEHAEHGTNVEPWRVELRKVTRKASDDLRAKAAQLGAYALTIPWYRLWSLLHFVPKRGDVLLASSELILISNRTHPRNQDDAEDNTRAYRHIQELLRMAVTK